MYNSDIVAIVVVSFFYFLLVWATAFVSLHMVFHQATDKESVMRFDDKWYRWRTQYMYHAMSYRFHVLCIWSFVVISIYETQLHIGLRLGIIAYLVGVSVFLKYVSKRVNNRIPSEGHQKVLYGHVSNALRSSSALDPNRRMSARTEGNGAHTTTSAHQAMPADTDGLIPVGTFSEAPTTQTLTNGAAEREMFKQVELHALKTYSADTSADTQHHE